MGTCPQGKNTSAYIESTPLVQHGEEPAEEVGDDDDDDDDDEGKGKGEEGTAGKSSDFDWLIAFD